MKTPNLLFKKTRWVVIAVVGSPLELVMIQQQRKGGKQEGGHAVHDALVTPRRLPIRQDLCFKKPLAFVRIGAVGSH